MHIGLDLRSFLKDETGIGVYFKYLLLSLAEIDRANHYYLFSTSVKARFPQAKLPDFLHMRFLDLRVPSRLLDGCWNRFRRPFFDSFFRARMDLTHSATPLLLPTNGRTIVTVHDLFYIDHPEMTDRHTRQQLVKHTEDSLLRADGVIAVSHFTRNDLLRKFDLNPAKVKVIYHGTSLPFRVPLTQAFQMVLQKKYRLPSTFLLFVGAVEPRKNLVALVDALKILHDKAGPIELIIAGRKGSDYPRLQERIVRNGLETWVRVLDYLPDEDIRGMYSLATLFVFPSLCEGFGFPLLEAMACGVPIVASNVSALPEIAGDAALFFDPKSVVDMAEAIQRGLENEEMRDAIIARGKRRFQDFAWERSARETLDFYQAVAGSE
jgi:glycosyltransferase involved in cell wall biosynthesis